MEQQIKLAAKLYQCRDTAKKMYGKDYQETLLPFIRRIRARMALDQCSELEAALTLIESLQELRGEATGTLLFSAAAVEMLKPSEKGVGE
jgi:hypothetical protein